MPTRMVLVEDRGVGSWENSGNGTGGVRGKRGKWKFSKATNFAIEKGHKMGIPPFWASPFPKTRRTMTSTATRTAKKQQVYMFILEKKTLHVHHAFLYIS